MRIFLVAVLLAILPVLAHAQIAHDFMISVGSDLIKTDNDGVFKKLQAGAEFNYFLHRRFTVTGGFEAWTDDEISFVIGGRWYATDVFFVRARGFVGVNDMAIGAGWNKPLGEKFRFEAMGDFYFEGNFAIRIGFNYVFRKELKSRQ